MLNGNSFFGWLYRYVRLGEPSKHIKLQWLWKSLGNMHKRMASLSLRATQCASISVLFIPFFQRKKLWFRNMLMPAKGAGRAGEAHFWPLVWSLAEICPLTVRAVHRVWGALLPGEVCPLSKCLSKGCILQLLGEPRWGGMWGSFWVTQCRKNRFVLEAYFHSALPFPGSCVSGKHDVHVSSA